MKKCVKKTCTLFLWMLLGLIISVLAYSLLSQIYGLLYKFMPDVFPLYNPVSGKEKYENFSFAMYLLSCIVSFVLTVYLSQRFNNDRFEFIITKTDGLYKIRDILKTYVCNFGLDDVISSLVNGIVFTVPIYFIPMQFFSSGTIIAEFTEPIYRVTERLGAAGAALFASLALLLSHVLTLVPVLKFYRAKWLTGFAEGTV